MENGKVSEFPPYQMTRITHTLTNIMLLVWYHSGYICSVVTSRKHVQEASTSSEYSHWHIQQQGAVNLNIPYLIISCWCLKNLISNLLVFELRV